MEKAYTSKLITSRTFQTAEYNSSELFYSETHNVLAQRSVSNSLESYSKIYTLKFSITVHIIRINGGALDHRNKYNNNVCYNLSSARGRGYDSTRMQGASRRSQPGHKTAKRGQNLVTFLAGLRHEK